MYVAMHFAAAAQVLLRLKCSFRLSAFSCQLIAPDPVFAGGTKKAES
jgi:hypothetical protein